jgi:hypothetical protein
MHRVLAVLAVLLLLLALSSAPIGGLAQPATPQTAVDLLPGDLFGPNWRLLGSRTTGGRGAATAQYGGPNGARIDLWVAVTKGMAANEVRTQIVEPIFAVYRSSYTDPERTEVVGDAVAGPLPPCATTQRLEGHELHYEFFPAGGTLCLLRDDAMVLVAFVGGEFNGLTGYRASDAVTRVVLDRMAHDWQLPQSLATPQGGDAETKG